MTHRSLAYETDPQNLANTNADNEQLEFVGDAVLGLVAAEALFRRFPQSHEGELTQLSSVVGQPETFECHGDAAQPGKYVEARQRRGA